MATVGCLPCSVKYEQYLARFQLSVVSPEISFLDSCIFKAPIYLFQAEQQGILMALI